MYPKLSLYINGQFVSEDGRTMQDVINPATQEVLGKLPHASQADLDAALQAAERRLRPGRSRHRWIAQLFCEKLGSSLVTAPKTLPAT